MFGHRARAVGRGVRDAALIVVAAGTATESKAFANKYKFAVAREKFPDSVAGFTKREKTAPAALSA